MAIKMVKRISAQRSERRTVPSENAANFTNHRFAFGNAENNTQAGCNHSPQGDNAAKMLPHHPGLTPRQRG